MWRGPAGERAKRGGRIMTVKVPTAPPGEDRLDQRGPSPTGAVCEPSAEKLVQLAEKIQGARARRRTVMGSDTIGEAGWEMLLALFRADAAYQRMTVSHLCDASHAPATTALRWIDRLVELDLVYRHKNPLDARVVFVELMQPARAAMHNYLCEVWDSLYGTNGRSR